MILLYTYFADFLNCSARDMDCLRSKTSDEIVDAQYKAEALVASLKLLEFFEPWLPYIDGMSRFHIVSSFRFHKNFMNFFR